MAISDLVMMAEKGVKRERLGVARSKSLWPFSTRMRLSEGDSLRRMLGEAEHALFAENVRPGLEACERQP